MAGKGSNSSLIRLGHVAPEGMVLYSFAGFRRCCNCFLQETDEGAEITGSEFTGELLPAGFILYGRYTSVTLASGKVIAYKGCNICHLFRPRLRIA